MTPCVASSNATEASPDANTKTRQPNAATTDRPRGIAALRIHTQSDRGIATAVSACGRPPRSGEATTEYRRNEHRPAAPPGTRRRVRQPLDGAWCCVVCDAWCVMRDAGYWLRLLIDSERERTSSAIRVLQPPPPPSLLLLLRGNPASNGLGQQPAMAAATVQYLCDDPLQMARKLESSLRSMSLVQGACPRSGSDWKLAVICQSRCLATSGGDRPCTETRTKHSLIHLTRGETSASDVAWLRPRGEDLSDCLSDCCMSLACGN
ncbi:hypothetical protein BKA56DRAFT_608400 [Ilyonectria sp. MPI-CAGE-AT-0026]|nr:hypothetical protein BKA56DRAFT_608400 [Ilyonectria sp. MPI-CAGE-AT-0026]